MHRYFLRGPRQGFGSLGLDIGSQEKHDALTSVYHYYETFFN